MTQRWNEEEKEAARKILQRQTCCFFGHRTVEDEAALFLRIVGTVRTLAEEYGVKRFLFGSRSAFDELCYAAVSALKAGGFPAERVAYLTSTDCTPYTQSASSAKKEKPLREYEGILYPPRAFAAGKAAYIERNRAMAEDSAFCVFCYNAGYSLQARREIGEENEKNSGTALMYEYAVKKEKRVFNLF